MELSNVQSLNVTLVEYIWLGGYNEIHSKCRTMKKLDSLRCEDFAMWNFDGKSTNQITCIDSELSLMPQKIFRDPFRKDGYMALCDAWYHGCIAPHESNSRFQCNQTMSKLQNHKPWVSCVFEFYMLDPKNELPIGYRHKDDRGDDPLFRRKYMTGSSHIFKRQMVDELYKMCIYAGLKVLLL